MKYQIISQGVLSSIRIYIDLSWKCISKLLSPIFNILIQTQRIIIKCHTCIAKLNARGFFSSTITNIIINTLISGHIYKFRLYLLRISRWRWSSRCCFSECHCAGRSIWIRCVRHIVIRLTYEFFHTHSAAGAMLLSHLDTVYV